MTKTETTPQPTPNRLEVLRDEDWRREQAATVRRIMARPLPGAAATRI